MAQREISEEMIVNCLENPDNVKVGQNTRFIAQKRLNSKMLRVVFEQRSGVIEVVTVYKAVANRYEVRI